MPPQALFLSIGTLLGVLSSFFDESSAEEHLRNQGCPGRLLASALCVVSAANIPGLLGAQQTLVAAAKQGRSCARGGGHVVVLWAYGETGGIHHRGQVTWGVAACKVLLASICCSTTGHEHTARTLLLSSVHAGRWRGWGAARRSCERGGMGRTQQGSSIWRICFCGRLAWLWLATSSFGDVMSRLCGMQPTELKRQWGFLCSEICHDYGYDGFSPQPILFEESGQGQGWECTWKQLCVSALLQVCVSPPPPLQTICFGGFCTWVRRAQEKTLQGYTSVLCLVHALRVSCVGIRLCCAFMSGACSVVFAGDPAFHA